MSSNRTWVNQRRTPDDRFNPMGRPMRRDDDSLDRGRSFDDRRLDNRGPGGGMPPVIGTVDRLALKLLNLYLEKKWNAEARMLDLSALIDADDLSELSPNLNTYNFCNKLAKTIADGKAWAQSLDSINLSFNNITTLKHLTSALLHCNVKLQNLAISNNAISSLKEVDWLSDLALREVMLADNPIAKKGDEYHKYVVKKLRSIELLDTVSVREWRRALLPKLPEPMDSQMTTEANAAMVFQICKMYFKCIDDQNFDAIIDAYDNDAFFSHVYQARTGVYQNTNSKAYHQTLAFKSHNLRLMDCSNVRECTKAVFKGRPSIVEVLRKDVYGRVSTMHDASKFKADAIVMGATVVASVHGMFQYKVDGDKTTFTSCFDRVFVLRPNKSGTEWPARIANDMVIFREEEETPILLPEKDLKVKLMKATGLNAAFAALLLKESAGNYDNALLLFNQNKAQGSIPPEAFA